MATDIKGDQKAVVQEVKGRAASFVAGVHGRLEKARANAKQKYLDLLELLGSVTKDVDEKTGNKSNFSVLYLVF